jgi:hypothetical protein
MSDITLEAVEAKQTELAQMIAKLRAGAAAATVLSIAAVSIELQPGERYAGAVLDADGKVMHHLVLLAAKPDGDLDWKAAMAWAAGVGGSLPTRQEQALLFANCKAQIEPRWHWSSETYEANASFAWNCDFDDGYQGNNGKSYEGCARAVRRLNPSVL